MTKTCRAKNRLSESPPITGPPRSSADDLGPDDRHPPGHRPADGQAPVGVRVPAEDLAGEEHAQRAEEQEDAQDPGQLARVLVGPVQEDLGHVGQHHHDHARPGVVVQRPQEPAERLLVVQVEQALVRLVGGRHVDQRQADAGDDLDHEQRHRGAAEDVPPAHRPGRLPGDGVPHHRQQGVAQTADERRASRPRRAASASWRAFPRVIEPFMPVVPGCPAASDSAAPGPPAGGPAARVTRQTQWKSPRGGGPEARSPLA